MDEKAWWLALHLVPGVGRITFKKLVGYFGHPRDVMQATVGQLTRVTGIGPKIAQAITGFQAARWWNERFGLQQRQDVRSSHRLTTVIRLC